MKLVHRVIALGVVVLLAACTNSGTMRKVNTAQPIGSPFTKYLAAEYRALANSLPGSRFAFIKTNAQYFARKSLAAADGIIVMPEVANSSEGALARVELIELMNDEGRNKAPYIAAVAQSRFDCWTAGEDGTCKRQFEEAVRAMKTYMGRADTSTASPAAAPVAPVVSAEEFPAPMTDDLTKGTMASVQQAMFIVFFDWNKYVLSSSANDVLDALAQELQTRQDIRQVIVVGHADTSGGSAYNKALSLKRATAVRDALVARGIPSSKLHAEGRGETDLLVKTPDNVREPGNRRAQITLE